MEKKKITVKIAEKQTKEIKITTDFIRLDAALKLADIAVTGGHAKIIIGDGEIEIDGEVCTQRGKKLRAGDSFEHNHTIYKII